MTPQRRQRLIRILFVASVLSAEILGLIQPLHRMQRAPTAPLFRTSLLERQLRRRSAGATPPEGPRVGKRPTDAALQTWRVFGVEVHPDDLQLDLDRERRAAHPPEDFLHPAVLAALVRRLRGAGVAHARVVRRSLDARAKRRSDGGGAGPRFVYVLDVDTAAPLKAQPGRLERIGAAAPEAEGTPRAASNDSSDDRLAGRRVIVVGAGPAGLFAALQLARRGARVVLLERGQPVERRGRDIGALMHRRALDPDSNFCFGEGGAGTWSDGKLTTRIGRNSGAVRFVLETLVAFGAPASILVDGAPHLGTDNLVRLLRNMRHHIADLGGEIMFGTKCVDLIIKDRVAVGVEYQVQRSGDVTEKGELYGDAIILATGHSARDMYERLHEAGVQLEAKGFAVGFRVEHPQKLINKIQYRDEWGPSVVTGKAPTDSANLQYFTHTDKLHSGKLPVPSYRLATDKAYDGERSRGVYSFCMCPGGQIVPASTDPSEVCVNGMSFSRRDSLWANSALVVTVSPDDAVLDEYRETAGVLAGVAFQRDMERKAAVMGGGNLTVPVQRLTDFINGVASTSVPASSYRLGVQPAACHEIYPPALTTALRHALTDYFAEQMPGYVCEDAVLHAVETRTSSPVRIARNDTDFKALGIDHLFPAGEGAGFAGGIVSAAVDGMAVAEAVEASLTGTALEGRPLQLSKSDNMY